MRALLLVLLVSACGASPKKCNPGEPGRLPEPLTAELIPVPGLIRARELRQGGGKIFKITLYLCAEPGGGVTSVRVARSTGPADLERHIMGHVQRWKFCPYELRPFEQSLRCNTLTFTYDFK